MKDALTLNGKPLAKGVALTLLLTDFLSGLPDGSAALIRPKLKQVKAALRGTALAVQGAVLVAALLENMNDGRGALPGGPGGKGARK